MSQSEKKHISIIGAGQLGSRHLQALKSVSNPLHITVIDPNEGSLDVARSRYEEIDPSSPTHTIEYSTSIPKETSLDIVIVATNSNVRRNVLEELLSSNSVKYLILEKLLFSRPQDFDSVSTLLEEKKVKAWVNCSMRMMPFFKKMKDELTTDDPIFYHVSGGDYGLITNAIHYIDHLAYLTGSFDYTIDISELDAKPFESKRKGFLEYNGTLTCTFSNGSVGRFTCFSESQSPISISVFHPEYRAVFMQDSMKAHVSCSKDEWTLEEVDAPMPYQSQMTTNIVESLLSNGTCDLAPFSESVKLHIPLLEGLNNHLNSLGEKQYDHYPFT